MTSRFSGFLKKKLDLSSGGTGVQNWSVLVPPDEIDVATQEYLDFLVNAQWSPESHLAIDLTDVSFMDSTGLHWLFSAREKATTAGREMRLIVQDGSQVDALLRIAGVAEVFPIYGSVEEAVKTA